MKWRCSPRRFPYANGKKMTVRLRGFTPPAPLSSLSIQKFIKSQQNLSKSPPKLWRDIDINCLDSNSKYEFQILTLNHPILRSLDSCSGLGQFNQTLAQLLVSGLFDHPLASGRVIKKLCSSPISLNRAVGLFKLLEDPDAFICNTIIRSYANSGDLPGALMFYYRYLIGNSIVPNHYTFPLLLKLCADIGSVQEGEKAHCWVLKFGLELDLFVKNSLIHMYAACGRILDARKLFDGGCDWDLVTWNSIIDGYVRNGDIGTARQLFDEMFERDVFTWNSMISGYVGIGDLEEAKMLFEKMPSRDTVSWNCIIDGFARAEDVSSARALFNCMPKKNVVSWNIMLSLYVRSKDYSECMRLLDQMIKMGEAEPNEATFVSVLIACGNLGHIDRGKWVHSQIENNTSIEPDVLLLTALLTMYIKCGDMDMAKRIFDQMPEKSIVSWNSMIMGYGTHGFGEKALEVFLQMERSGQVPNDATFVCLLAACAHTGMVLEGWWYFDVMRRVYKFKPKVEHYGCMVDLLGRAGLVKDSREMIKQIPLEAGSTLWGALLSSCHTHTDSALGELLGNRLIEQNPEDIGAYMMLSNIYAAQGKWDEVEKIRKLVKERGLYKVAGSSKTSFGESCLEIALKNCSNHKRNMIYSMLKEIRTCEQSFTGKEEFRIETHSYSNGRAV